MSDLPPSEGRRREARRVGQVPHSPLLTGAAALAGGGLALALTARPATVRLAQLARRCFSGELPAAAGLGQVLSLVTWIVLPVATAALAAAVAAGMAQTRGLVTAGAFERRTDEEPVALPLAGWALSGALLLFAILSGRRALGGVDALESLWPRVVLLFGAAGVADFLLRRARVERSLMMTRAERRAEARQDEANPLLRAELGRRHRALSGRSLVDDLQKAEVVLAAEGVALALRREGAGIRVVMAAERLQATRLVEVARRLGLMVRGDDRLASALAELRAGDWVPPPHLPRALALIARR